MVKSEFIVWQNEPPKRRRKFRRRKNRNHRRKNPTIRYLLRKMLLNIIFYFLSNKNIMFLIRNLGFDIAVKSTLIILHLINHIIIISLFMILLKIL